MRDCRHALRVRLSVNSLGANYAECDDNRQLKDPLSFLQVKDCILCVAGSKIKSQYSR